MAENEKLHPEEEPPALAPQLPGRGWMRLRQ